MEDAKKCIRCKLPFIPEDWEDNMCKECRGEVALESYQEWEEKREEWMQEERLE